MDPDLEAIVTVDEGGRVRVDAARQAAQIQISDARAAATRRREAERQDRLRLVTAEVDSILGQARREAAERQARRAAYLKARDARAETLRGRAAQLYALIIRQGPPRGGG